ALLRREAHGVEAGPLKAVGDVELDDFQRIGRLDGRLPDRPAVNDQTQLRGFRGDRDGRQIADLEPQPAARPRRRSPARLREAIGKVSVSSSAALRAAPKSGPEAGATPPPVL